MILRQSQQGAKDQKCLPQYFTVAELSWIVLFCETYNRSSLLSVSYHHYLTISEINEKPFIVILWTVIGNKYPGGSTCLPTYCSVIPYSIYCNLKLHHVSFGCLLLANWYISGIKPEEVYTFPISMFSLIAEFSFH